MRGLTFTVIIWRQKGLTYRKLSSAFAPHESNIRCTFIKPFSFKMPFDVDYQLSPEADGLPERLNKKFGSGKLLEVSDAWLELLGYDLLAATDLHKMEVENNTMDVRENIVNLVKETLQGNSTLSEAVFVCLSDYEVNKILCDIRDFLDEMTLPAFCNLLASWNNDALVKSALGSIILPKLQEISESSACLIHSIKQLALSKPECISQNLITPLLTNGSFQFTDSELLTEVFSVLPLAQKDTIILNASKKSEYEENDWQMLNPLIRYMSQNSLLVLMECIWKFSNRFTKSQVFGRFLVTFCKHLELTRNKETLREVVEKHETLLKMQALKYLNLM